MITTIGWTLAVTVIVIFALMWWHGGKVLAGEGKFVDETGMVRGQNSVPAPISGQAASWDEQPITLTDIPDEDSGPSVGELEAVLGRSATYVPDDHSADGVGDDHTKLIGRTLSRYGADADVALLGSGATVTRYQLTPKGTTKVSQLTGLSNELTVAVGVPVRVGLENATVVAETVNGERGTVGFRPVRTDDLTVFAGTDATGEPVTIDLARLPHMLVAGTTGSGKSVFLNSLLCGLLMKDPGVVWLSLVDPKFVELAAFEDAAHVDRVVNEPADAIDLLADMCDVMDLRYAEMKQLGVRTFDDYRAATGQPYQVVVIDEFADLIGQDKNVVRLVQRLGQKGRAAGVHLIVATQKPNADVIPTAVSENLPARVAFQVAKSDASRVILGENGAEQLAGKGDGLLSTTEWSGRFQSVWLSDDDVEHIVESTIGVAV